MKRSHKLSIVLALALPLGIGFFWFASTSRAATETPDYKVVRSDEKFEIREYPTLTVATVPMEGGEMNGGFNTLFRFITGSNEKREKIEMTSPVLIDTKEDGKTMSFIMPKATIEKGVPKPTAEGVTVTKIEAARFAVLRFPGGRTAENESKAIEKLKAWLAEQKIAGQSEPVFAYYDPPWTPVFMRRNEVMIRIGPTDG